MNHKGRHHHNSPQHGSPIDERRDWYERDMMDERSGYRSDTDPRQFDRRRRERERDVDRTISGNTYDSERWGSGHIPRDSSRDYSTGYSRDYNRAMPSDYVGSSKSFAGVGPKGYKRSDERIKEDLNEILTRHHDIDASDISFEIKDGEVTLSGTVPERRMKYLTEDATERCFGVKDIINNIRIKKELPVPTASSAAPKGPSH